MAPDVSAFNAAFPDATRATREVLTVIFAPVLGLAATAVPGVLNKSAKTV
jgi:hypothetical protein